MNKKVLLGIFILTCLAPASDYNEKYNFWKTSQATNITGVTTEKTTFAKFIDMPGSDKLPAHISLENPLLKRPIGIKGNTNPDKLHLCDEREKDKPIKGIAISFAITGCLEEFLQGDRSINWLVTQKGELINIVPNTHRSWAVGLSARSNIVNKRNYLSCNYPYSCNSEVVSIWLETDKREYITNAQEKAKKGEKTTVEDEDIYTPAQIEALNALLKALTKEYNIKPFDIFTHSDCAIKPDTGGLGMMVPGPFIPWSRLESGANVTADDMEKYKTSQPFYDELFLNNTSISLELRDKIYFLHLCSKLGYFIPTTPGNTLIEQYSISEQLFREIKTRFEMRWYHMDMPKNERKPTLERNIKIAITALNKYNPVV